MTFAALIEQIRYTNPETQVVETRGIPATDRAAAAAAIRAKEAEVDRRTNRIGASLFGGRASLSSRTNKNPFTRRIDRLTPKLAVLGEDRQLLQVARNALA